MLLECGQRPQRGSVAPRGSEVAWTLPQVWESAGLEGSSLPFSPPALSLRPAEPGSQMVSVQTAFIECE